jgi:hypothetical protein
MEGHIAGVGKMEKHTVTECARGRRDKGSTPALGSTVSRFLACTLGQVEIIIKGNGFKENAMDLA